MSIKLEVPDGPDDSSPVECWQAHHCVVSIIRGALNLVVEELAPAITKLEVWPGVDSVTSLDG